ncbi:hypothetical protein DICPUDRAFT_78242 [Dictyostelium purpureum]|uniref:SnoaL-like domain-containing protein n=1 Tax=Dictyostelium purpureum TaxID=5786 RepID=F0ZIZ8_DICPU|nr:uncharacterized protein DICPUDRAFT_78242 [Dictyostelium purpureum]EGC36070.1 hypothetical protein DICPUDRAFT_78242 [Dictyostelium purpureum]|eukprot:XP_003287388.1 hypothetical protein DICPUDRAFT_78242 [Dictyostelium purpureum]
MKLLYALLILVIVFFAGGIEANKTDKSNKTTEERIRDEIKVWEQNWSGFPINCRRMVDTLSSDGVVEYPVGKNIIGGGHKRIFNRCEAFITENFSQMINYAHEPVYIVGREVAFKRTTVFVTKNNCRLYNTGIVTIKYDKDFKIKQLKDYFDADDLVSKFQACQFPGSELPDINAEEKPTEKPVEEPAETVAQDKKQDKKEKTKDEL